MLNIPDLNKFKVFHAVYTTSSLTAAAQTLNVTRSAVSQSLKALEDELRTKLFIRDSKKVIPTEPAAQLFRTVQPFMLELQVTLGLIETGKKNPIGHLRIGAPQDFGSIHLTEAIVDFRKMHPQVTFELMLAIPTVLLEHLSNGRLDMAFVDNGDVHAEKYPVSVVTVMREKFILVCSKGYFDKNVPKSKLTYSQIRELDFIDYLAHAPVSKMWMKYHFRKFPADINVVFSAESVRAVIRATQGGLGVSVLPEHLIAGELKAGKLKELIVGNHDWINQIVMARRLEKPVTAREKEFVDFYKRRVGLSK